MQLAELKPSLDMSFPQSQMLSTQGLFEVIITRPGDEPTWSVRLGVAEFDEGDFLSYQVNGVSTEVDPCVKSIVDIPTTDDFIAIIGAVKGDRSMAIGWDVNT